MKRNDAIFWAGLCSLVLASRLCHAGVLWADEDYHLAAAIQALHGKVPYRDFWYDKPPLNLLFYLLFGARTGIALRIADTVFVCLCCRLAYRFAERLWSRREGFAAAGALAFFLIFYLAPGVIPLEPDTLMLAPHLAAVYLAFRRRPLLAGIAAGLAFQLNVRGVVVLASAALFVPEGLPMLLAGFLIPNAIVLGWIAAAGAWPAYIEQVWKWGLLYARAPANPQFMRILNWMGFHAALLLGAVCLWMRERKLLVWFLFSLAVAVVGWDFAPRYFNVLLPPLVISAAPVAARRAGLAALMLALLAIPLVRFAPQYVRQSRDVAMDRESQEAARIVEAAARPGDTIFIWGYRPDIVAYTRMPVAGRFWDSQPLTGVPADRHLSDARPVSAEWARQNREEFARTERPTFLVDGLSLYNPQLDMRSLGDLDEFRARYCVLGQAGGTRVYVLCER